MLISATSNKIRNTLKTDKIYVELKAFGHVVVPLCFGILCIALFALITSCYYYFFRKNF